MKIIGLSGKMQSGKSTVAEWLEGQLKYTQIYGFSYPIKVMCLQYFNSSFTPNELNGQSAKESLHESGLTYRQILVRLGIEMRNIWNDVWVRKWAESICAPWGEESTVTIVPDVRFPNEVKAIQDMGGIVIRLTRDPVGSMDETETALDIDGNYYTGFKNANRKRFDHIVDNSDLSIGETNKICLKIAREYING